MKEKYAIGSQPGCGLARGNDLTSRESSNVPGGSGDKKILTGVGEVV